MSNTCSQFQDTLLAIVSVVYLVDYSMWMKMLQTTECLGKLFLYVNTHSVIIPFLELSSAGPPSSCFRIGAIFGMVYFGLIEWRAAGEANIRYCLL